MSISSILNLLLLLRNQLKIYHWQTLLYSRHKSSDEFIESIEKLTDKFIEAWSGCNGPIKIEHDKNTLKLNNYNDDHIIKFIVTIKKIFLEETANLPQVEFISIRDEILMEINKLLYLFKQN